jgi:hypothetical protein
MASNWTTDDFSAGSRMETDDAPEECIMDTDKPPVDNAIDESSAANALEEVLRTSYLAFVNMDCRPTFVVGIDQTRNDLKVTPLFCNKALEDKPALLRDISGTYPDDKSNISWGFTYSGFKQHVSYGASGDDDATSTTQFLFRDFSWTRFLAFGQWIVMSGTTYGDYSNIQKYVPETRALEKPVPIARAPATKIMKVETKTDDGYKRKREKSEDAPQPPKPAKRVLPADRDVSGEPCMDTPLSFDRLLDYPLPSFDWLTRVLTEKSHPHLKRLRAMDWAKTPLGPPEHWPAILRSYSNRVLVDPNPAVLFWGEQNIMIYNDHYRNLIGPECHARSLGTNVFVRSSFVCGQVLGNANLRNRRACLNMPTGSCKYSLPGGQLDMPLCTIRCPAGSSTVIWKQNALSLSPFIPSLMSTAASPASIRATAISLQGSLPNEGKRPSFVGNH